MTGIHRASRALALGLLLCAAARAEENPGVTAAPVLQIPMGSRALGMGGAFTAVGTDASALYYNPGALGRLSAHEASVTFLSGLAGGSLQNLAYAGPTPFAGVSGNGYTSVGASLLLSQSGTIEINRLNPDGSLRDTESTSAGGDMVAALGYAERIGNTTLEAREGSFDFNHYLGAAGKFVRSTLAGGYSAQAFALDAGYLAHSPEAGVGLGLAVCNAGGRMKFVEQADPLPLAVRGGLSYQFGVPSVHNVIAAGDAEYQLYDKQWAGALGIEYFWLKNYGLRLGYQLLRDSLGLTIGFGLRWRGRVMVDYAWGLSNGLSDAHRVTLSYRFGGVTSLNRGRLRRPFIDSAPEREKLRETEQITPATEPPARRVVPRGHPGGVPGWIY